MHVFLANKKIEGANETEGVLIRVDSADEAERLALFWTEMGKQMKRLQETGFFDDVNAVSDAGVDIAPRLAPLALTGYRVVIRNPELGDATFGQDAFFLNEEPKNMRYLRWLRGFALEDFGQVPYKTMLSPDGFVTSLLLEPDGEKYLAKRVPVLKRTYAEMADVFRRAKGMG